MSIKLRGATYYSFAVLPLGVIKPADNETCTNVLNHNG